MPDLANLQLPMALLAAFLVGISKSGLKGISLIIVTLMALAYGSKASTGIVLPLLIVGDIFAVWYYRRYADWSYLFKLLPWMLFGVLIGVWFGADLPELVFKKVMAGIIFLTVLIMFWWDRQKETQVPDNLAFAASMGLGAGFATMIGNLAGAFSNLFFLAMRLPKNAFIGTAAWLFFIINLFKLPFHIFVWKTVSWESFYIGLKLIPSVLLGLWLGVRLVAKIKDQSYRKLILWLTLFGAALILFK